ncbi:MAG: TonB-dependent receptor [Bryobacteraceae bacterium]|jgi:hypothetical protein
MLFKPGIFVLCLLYAVHGASAAANQGGISGVVISPGGAPEASAHVALVRRLGGASRELVTDAAGKYAADGLLPGSYTITATSPATGASAEESVEIRDGETLHLALVLGSAPMADSDLPIEGRNYLDLVRNRSEIAPGEQGGAIEGFGPYGLRGNASLNSYGQRGQNNNFLLDGMDNNGAWVRGLVVPPALETAGGIALLAGYIPAEFGHAAGAVVNVASRAGSDRFHGSAYEYGQTSVVDARNFFDPAKKPVSAGNQFGAALGGPIRPGRWFFFLDAAAERERQGQTVTSTVPTKAQKAGVFSPAATIYDPQSIHSVATDIYQRSPFPGNQILLASILPPARSLLALYPDPTSSSSVDNYSFPAERILNNAGFDVRSDYAFSPTSTLFARLSAGSLDEQSPGALPAPTGIGFPAGGYAGSDSSQNADALHSHETWRAGAVSHTASVFSGRINEFRAGFTIDDLSATAADSGFNAASALHIPGLGSGGMPSFSVPGYASLGAAGAAPFTMREATYQVEDAIGWKTRRHSWKFGVQAIRRQVSGDASEWSSRGTFFFTPDYTSQPGAFDTGDAFASLLFGYPSEVRRNVQFAPFRLQAWEWAGFAQDSFRLGRLTVDAGVRYSLYPPVTSADGQMVNFNFDRQAPALNQFAGQGGVNGYAGVGYKKLTIAPRIGLAFDLTGNGSAVLRAGFNQAYDAGSFFSTGSLARNPPYASNLDIVNGTFQLGPNLTTGLPAATAVSLLDAAALNSARGSINAIQPVNYTPYSDQWSLALQTRLRDGLILETGGMGSMGIHLSSTYDANQPYPAPSPYSHPRYPYEPYHSRIEYLGFAGGSTYYGGTVKLAGHWRSGLAFQLSYTYAKSLDDATAPDSDQQSRPAVPQFVYNLRGARSPSPYDATQRMVWTARYDLPVKNPASKPLTLLANWSLYAVVTAQTGFPFTPQLSTNSLNNGGIQLPNRVGDGSLPADRRSYLNWFDTSLNPSDPSHAFETPALYQYGNSGFDILRGPGMATVNAALARTFAIGDLARLQARVEAYNLLNRTNFALPERLLGLATSGVIDHTATPARQLQLGVTLEW